MSNTLPSRHPRLLIVALMLGILSSLFVPATSANADALPENSLPTVVHIVDPRTGKVIGTEPVSEFSTLITRTNSCVNNSYACYFSGQVPLADQGFYGTAGTSTGSWASRSGGWSGNYNAKWCWTDGGTVCGPWWPPNAAWGFPSGTLRTGVSVTIS